MTEARVLEKRCYDKNDIQAVYDIGETKAEQMIRRIRVVLYPPTTRAEKDNHPLPCGKVYATDLPVFEERMRELKGRDQSEG